MVGRRVSIGLLLGTLAAGNGCSPYLVRGLANAAVLTAVIVGTAHVMAQHDAHMHFHACGHHRRWHRGHWVYYYDDHWEYYEPRGRTWYYYPEAEGEYDYGEE